MLVILELLVSLVRMHHCLLIGKLIMWNWTAAIRFPGVWNDRICFLNWKWLYYNNDYNKLHQIWMLDTQISDATWIIPEDLWFIRAVGPYIRFMLESAWVLLLFQRREENLFGLLNSKPNFTAIIEHCNLWRNYDDIQDSWSSLESIIDYYGNNQDAIVPNAGPGHWNDPDMVSFNTQHYLKTSMIFRQLIYLYAGWRH